MGIPDGIGDQIVEDLVHPIRIQLPHRKRRCHIFDEMEPLFFQQRFQQLRRPFRLFSQIHRLEMEFQLMHLGQGQIPEIPHQPGQPHDFFLHGKQFLRLRFFHSVQHAFQMPLEHRQGRFQFMGDIGQKFLPVAFIGSQLGGHLVEHFRQLAHFILGIHRDFLFQVPLTDLFRRLGQLPERAGDVPGQEIADHQPHSCKQEANPPQGLVIGFHKGPFRRPQHHPVVHASHAAPHHPTAHALAVDAGSLLARQGGRILEILEKVGFHLLAADVDHNQGTDQDQQESAHHHFVPYTVKAHGLSLRICSRSRTPSGCTGDFWNPVRFSAAGSGYGHQWSVHSRQRQIHGCFPLIAVGCKHVQGFS